jgi:hypothetical protein
MAIIATRIRRSRFLFGSILTQPSHGRLTLIRWGVHGPCHECPWASNVAEEPQERLAA